jgi:hypothetical protein
MNFNFDDPNWLINDYTPLPSEILLNEVTALQPQRIKVLKLELGEDILKDLRSSRFATIQFFNSSVRVDQNGITIETYGREYSSCPKEAKEAFAVINQVMWRPIRYKKDNGVDYLWCNEGSSHGNRKDSQKAEKYITAAKDLPDLLRENRQLLVESAQQERFIQFKRQYRTQALWIEYYLLESSDTLTELGEKRPTERQYKPGKISAKLHGLIQDMWAEATNNKNPLCQWILAFDCPSQVWLALEAILVLQQWDKGPPKNRFQLHQAEQHILKRLREYTGIKVTSLYSDKEDENFFFLDEAFSFTLIRLLESGVELAQYQDYLDARTGQANLVRKGRTRKRSNRGFGTSR